MKISGRHAERTQTIYCRSCGYELLNLPAGKCPECGQRFDPEDLRSVTITPPVIVDQIYLILLHWVRRMILYVVVCFFILVVIGTCIMFIGNLLGLQPNR